MLTKQTEKKRKGAKNVWIGVQNDLAIEMCPTSVRNPVASDTDVICFRMTSRFLI